MPRNDRYSYHHPPTPRVASIPVSVFCAVPLLALIVFAGLVCLFTGLFR